MNGVQHRARECPDRSSGPEQAGVAGRPSERPGILIMHFADERPPAPGIVFRWGDAVAPVPEAE